MKRHVETALASRFHVTVLARSGAVVSSFEFTTLPALLSRLERWHVVVTDDQLAAPYPRYSPSLRTFMQHARTDGSLRINVYAASTHISGDEALDLIAGRPVAPGGPPPFRDGPVKGTGKRGPYRFFRRRIRTADSHREGSYPDDGCEDVPELRAARNRANLPSGRDDIPRCRTRSWKATRRHQWRVHK
ncbi:hypothetical protein OIU34_18750 [Pararhizobium sp. BT-229]|uniref:hypothetical protein n=1 Tax=Pararhizobium sp. BT-229 TaxID=2986923 RepID=UPI0021F7BD89|nr:hypothetical protein [Pararhizobium sp. BT-229]MCV9963920.1 hypothetical protein [Pararhizobium sp. BT-229]